MHRQSNKDHKTLVNNKPNYLIIKNKDRENYRENEKLKFIIFCVDILLTKILTTRIISAVTHSLNFNPCMESSQ